MEKTPFQNRISTVRVRSSLVMLTSFILSLTLLLVAAPAVAHAAPGDEFEVAGVKYRVLTESPEGNTAEVAGPGAGFSGALVVPGSVTSASVEYAITGIAGGAFENNTLSSVDFSGAAFLTYIGGSAFANCPGLSGSLRIPAGVTTIGYAAFAFCTSLDSLDLSSAANLATIGSNAFQDCTGFISIDFSGAASLTSIGSAAFVRCASLGGMVVPGSLISIGNGAFYECTGLAAIDFSGAASLTSIGHSAFFKCTGLASLDLSGASSLSSIGDGAFVDCTSITGGLIIPATVQTIENGAFYGTGLQAVSFKGTPAHVGAYLFGDASLPNTSLVYIELEAALTAPSGWNPSAFNSVPSAGMLAYPDGATGFWHGEFGTPYLDGWTRASGPIITSAAAASFPQGAGGTFQFAALSDLPAIWALDGAPVGISVNFDTGMLTVPAALGPGTYPFTVVAMNEWGTMRQPFTLTVAAPAPTPPLPTPAGGAGTGLAATGDVYVLPMGSALFAIAGAIALLLLRRFRA